MSNIDMVFLNGNIITMNKSSSLAEAVAIKNGVIIEVGTNENVKKLIGPQTRVIDLDGLTMLPGINDSHLHVPTFGSSRPPVALCPTITF